MPSSERRLDSASLMAYGAATWDWHRLHYDVEYVRERGLDAPVVDGQMFGALCAQSITAWLGPTAFIAKLAYKMRRMVFAGDTLTLEGEVANVETDSGNWLITIEQRGSVGDEVAVQATTLVRVPQTETNLRPATP